MAVIFGTVGEDRRNGTNNDDTISGGVNDADTPPDTGDDAFNGLEGNDSILGLGADDTLRGAAGNDTLDGGLGHDSLLGGTDDDLLIAGNGLDRLAGGPGNDTLDGTGSDGLEDKALYRGAAAAVTIDLRIAGPQNTGGGGVDTFIEIESVDGSEFNDHLMGNGGRNTLYGYGGNDTLEGNGNYDWLDGGEGDDSLVGSGAQGNALVGNEGNDTLVGNDGNSVFYGRAGNDLMTGGAGDEVFWPGSGDDSVDGGGGGGDYANYGDVGVFGQGDTGVMVDLAIAGPQDTKNAGIDTLVNLENILGTRADDTLSGTDGGNKIFSSDGDDEVHGRGGNDSIADSSGLNFLSGGNGDDTIVGGDFAGESDTLEGGNGNDSLDGQAGSDTADYRAAGTALLTVDLGITGPQFTGNGTDTLLSIENVLGSAQFDQLTGNGANNALSGFDSNDTLLGRGGNDTLDGGAGDDAVNGEDGVDIASFASAAAAVHVTLTTGLFQDTGQGFDALTSIEGLIGSKFADSLTGNDGNNILDGGAGLDTLAGGLGDDTYILRGGTRILFPFQYVHDTIVEAADGGTDTVRVSGAAKFQTSYTLGDNLENATAIGESPFGLVGNAAHNVLTGNNYANRLDGAGGVDTLRGSYGDDTYVLNDLHSNTGGFNYDRIVEGQFAGIDTVEIHLISNQIAGYTLGFNLDNALLKAAGAFDLTGNALGNLLQGNGGANRLSGLIGNDLLRGLGGPDTLVGGAGADTLVGGIGRDSLIGGPNDDVFDYNDLKHSGATMAAADRIGGFAHLMDRIDVSTIDAIGGGADNAFTFIGGAGFTAPGQIRAFASGGDTVVAFNTSGETGAEMLIVLNQFAPGTLTAGDFIL